MPSSSVEVRKFPLVSHFTKPSQQSEAARLGVWLFLATEILLFGGLFVAYGVYRFLHPDLFIAGHKFLDVNMGALNTIVLLFSSLTVVLSIHAAQQNKYKWVTINLILTILCACIFLVVKYIEYSHKIHAGLLPGYNFINGTLPNPDQIHVFFGIYFMMTGLHGIHVIFGIIILSWLLVKSWRRELCSQYYTPLELGGLYWHLVDVIWVFLFPLLYLIS